MSSHSCGDDCTTWVGITPYTLPAIFWILIAAAIVFIIFFIILYLESEGKINLNLKTKAANTGSNDSIAEPVGK